MAENYRVVETSEETMKKLLLSAACIVALSTAAYAQNNMNSNNPTAGVKANADVSKNKANASGSVTTGTGAGNQKQFGGNPDAGGGPRGSAQSTINPNASKEIGGGK